VLRVRFISNIANISYSKTYLSSTMLQKASQWAALLASQRASAMGVSSSAASIARVSPLVLSSVASRGYASTAGVAPEHGANPPVHSQPAPKIKTTRLTNLGNVS
jgi:hypothetical protein